MPERPLLSCECVPAVVCPSHRPLATLTGPLYDEPMTPQGRAAQAIIDAAPALLDRLATAERDRDLYAQAVSEWLGDTNDALAACRSEAAGQIAAVEQERDALRAKLDDLDLIKDGVCLVCGEPHIAEDVAVLKAETQTAHLMLTAIAVELGVERGADLAAAAATLRNERREAREEVARLTTALCEARQWIATGCDHFENNEAVGKFLDAALDAGGAEGR